MFNNPIQLGNVWPIPETASERAEEPSTARPETSYPLLQDYGDSRQVKLALNEPKRRLICDARVLRQSRGITQAQMADELGISKRTLEEWLQFRRMPQAPSEALLRRWVNQHQHETI